MLFTFGNSFDSILFGKKKKHCGDKLQVDKAAYGHEYVKWKSNWWFFIKNKNEKWTNAKLQFNNWWYTFFFSLVIDWLLSIHPGNNSFPYHCKIEKSLFSMRFGLRINVFYYYFLLFFPKCPLNNFLIHFIISKFIYTFLSIESIFSNIFCIQWWFIIFNSMKKNLMIKCI